jgi:L-alanine-DL-glutamate epimerase-like enolase superfamily enzyme
VFNRHPTCERVPVYAGGGCVFPDDDVACLRDEAQKFRAMGFSAMKMKIGTCDLATDCKRIETVLDVVEAGNNLAVDAMNVYVPARAREVAARLEPYGLKWFEDVCDPLDFETHRELAQSYRPPLSAGEAIFSASDARNLLRYAGLRKNYDVLTFDPAHCYGISEYARIIEMFEEKGWTARDFQPHGGHLYSLHVAIGLGLGGCECNPHNFHPFGGFADGAACVDGHATVPDLPGIGFESRSSLMDLFHSLAGTA